MLKGIFHIHTKISFDSLIVPESIVEFALKNGIDFVAVTDHNTIKGAELLEKIGKIKVIKGAEYSTEKGDIIGLFLKREIKSKNSSEVIRGIREQKGIVYLPHPYKNHKLDRELVNKVDLIEVFNARSSIEENRKALKLAYAFKKIPVAGSDAHFIREVGLTKMVYNGNGDLKRIILENRGCIVECERSFPVYELLGIIVKTIKLKRIKILRELWGLL
ncbi:MAG: PHP domain-containing protein [Candidatus Cloacimonadota bacterium]|nr:MAG: PHP domain-containing protein [Candidatus Cloacimonadota bacterium]